MHTSAHFIPLPRVEPFLARAGWDATMGEAMPSIDEAVLALQEGRWDDYLAAIYPRLRSDKEQLWRDLAAVHPTSVNLIALLPTFSKDQALDVCHRFLPAIGVLPSFSQEDALSLLEYAESIDVSHRFGPGQQLGLQIRAHNELGVSLGDILRARGAQTEAARRTWALAFASGAPQVAAHYALGLIGDNLQDVQLLGSLIDFLPMSSPDVCAKLLPHQVQIADLLKKYTAEFPEASWSAIASFSKISARAADHLIEAINAGDVVAAVKTAWTLYGVDTPTYGSSSAPLESVVTRLLEIGVAHADSRASIDQPVSSLLLHDALRPLVVASLVELCALPANVVEMFGETFRGVTSHPTAFATLMSEWLLRSGAYLPSIRSLISLCTTDQASAALDGAAFQAHGERDTLAAVRRILATTHHGPTLCQFIAAIADMHQLGNARFDLAGQMLNLSFAEYPGATEEFLKERTRLNQRSHAAAPVYREVYANVLRWRRVLTKLPPLKEIRATDAETQTIRALKRRFQREVMRVAAEKSVFAEIFSTANVAQGRRFATHSRFGAPQMATMTQTSHYVELPSSELADPMGGELARMKFLENAR